MSDCPAAPVEPCSPWDLAKYFLRLGTLGFGGPIALVGAMERDLVDQRRWVSKQDYLEGLALSELAPGPLAAQLAIYLGWVRAGVPGATLIGVAFILPSFLMVLALSALYVRFGGLAWMQAAFYGIGAGVIAVISRSAFKLMKTVLERDWLLWAICVVNALATALTENEILWLFVASGLVVLGVRTLPGRGARLAVAWPGGKFWLAGIHGPADPNQLVGLFAYFFKAALVIFGSGLAVVPFLHGGVVQQLHWLDERQFLDAVAVAMITPGPVVITVAFIGYLVAGPLGAVAAAVGIFAPVYLVVVALAPSYRRWSRDPRLQALVLGVTAAATGSIAGAVIVLGRRAIVDPATATIAVGVLALLILAKRLPEPVTILLAGTAGFAVKTLHA